MQQRITMHFLKINVRKISYLIQNKQFIEGIQMSNKYMKIIP